MPKWLIAVFSLHFLASVALSTLGLMPLRAIDPGQDDGAGVAAQQSVQQPRALDTASLLDDFDHALMDDQQDLPDVMHARLALAALQQPACRHVEASVSEGPSHAPSPPDRPPPPARPLA